MAPVIRAKAHVTRAKGGQEFVDGVLVALAPALVSIAVACEYLGDISRAKFYADVLPSLEVVKLGNRTLILVASLDRFIAAMQKQDASERRRRISEKFKKHAIPSTTAAEVEGVE